MRYAFSQTLFSEAKKNSSIVLLTGDLGYTVFEKFEKNFPNRFFNMGAAEANMIGAACGMALSGLTPFVYSIAPFATMRGFEQIRTDVCLHNANVKIVGSGAGLSYGHAGPTHHALEDIAILRSLPNMTIVCTSDPVTSTWITKEAVQHSGPVYIRLGKKGEPVIHSKKTKLEIGKGVILSEGSSLAIVATGNIVYTALQAAELLKKEGIHATVIDMHTIKPLDNKLIHTLAKKHRGIVTIEEHTILGGLGTAVAEAILEIPHSNLQFFEKIGVPDTFTLFAGSHEYLRDIYGLTPKKIASRITKLYEKHS